MATRQDDVVPDFLRMDDAIGSDPANANKTGNWNGENSTQKGRTSKGCARANGSANRC